MQGKEKALGATAETTVGQVCEAVHFVESVFLLCCTQHNTETVQLHGFGEQRILIENFDIEIKIKKGKSVVEV